MRKAIVGMMSFVLAAGLLAGCTGPGTGGGGQTQQPSDTTRPSDPPVQSSTPPPPVPGPTPSPVPSPTQKVGSRADYADKVTAQLTCQKDSRTIHASSGVYEAPQDCDDITIEGNDVVLLALNVGDISVKGNNNRIYVVSLGEISLKGNGNVVAWETGETRVYDNGTGNIATKI